MALYRENLPQLSTDPFLLDGGQETHLIYNEGRDLPCFASFTLMDDADGRAALRRYYESFARIAIEAGTGFIFDSPTWRASPDWAAKLGYSRAALDGVLHDSIAMLHDLRTALQTPRSPMVVSGCMGPRGDGYVPGEAMTAEQAADYHRPQIAAFRAADADMVAAITMTNTEEATGFAMAAKAEGMPIAISFTLETDGRLPTGQTLGEAIDAVEDATGGSPAYYMINCAHPTHFDAVLQGDAPWLKRLRGLRANASKCSHAELDTMTELDIGDPLELGTHYRALRARLPQFTILGGCCGTDHRHIEEIRHACLRAA